MLARQIKELIGPSGATKANVGKLPRAWRQKMPPRLVAATVEKFSAHDHAL